MCLKGLMHINERGRSTKSDTPTEPRTVLSLFMLPSLLPSLTTYNIENIMLYKLLSLILPVDFVTFTIHVFFPIIPSNIRIQNVKKTFTT